MRKILCILLLLVAGLAARAQSRVMAGRVADATGEGIPGAGIVCKEFPAKGTVTDLDGNFTLKIPDGTTSVTVSCLGYQDKSIPVAEPLTGLVIVLEEDMQGEMLDQVVVTGYAQTTTKQVTGSVAVIDGEALHASPLSGVDALMAGEVAGVSIKATSGAPGTQSRIRIRGTNNLSGNSDPLWVVDGVPLQGSSNLTREQISTGGFDDIFVSGVGGINPNDIESITILKDAAAAAIYGSRAANGVIVVTTRKGTKGKMKVGYSNNFSLSFRPQRSLNLMNASEKLDWEQTLWDEFSAAKFAAAQTDPTVIYPVVGIVGQIRSGSGAFAGLSQAQQDAEIDKLRGVDTNWYKLLLRNAFQMNHHLSLSGGADRVTYYLSAGVNDDNGMLIRNNYQRYSLNANIELRPVDRLKLTFGMDASHQRSLSPDSYVDPFTYAYFANPYERAYDENGDYAPDNTWFTLGYYNGREAEEVLPLNGFSILRELKNNETKTLNTAATVRAQADLMIIPVLHFNALASYSYSHNATDKVVEKSTYTAFRDRLGADDHSQTNLYGSITQNRTNRHSYIARGHFTWNQTFDGKRFRHNLNVIAGAEIRGSSSNSTYTKRYNYDPVTGTTSLPPVSGPVDEWIREVERLNGQFFSDTRFASFYASADYYLGKTFVFNASFRTDGSSNFGVKRQFNPTWSAGAAWHWGEEKWAKQASKWLSHGTLRAAYGYTGNISTAATHQLVMQYRQQEYRYYGSESYPLGTIPAAPNPELGWEKTSDLKAGIDVGFLGEKLTLAAEWYLRQSSDVVTSSQVQSTTGFTSVYFNSADILNTGVETTLTWKQNFGKDWRIRASVNFAYNYNKVTRYNPPSQTITAKDRYVEGYPVGAIFAGELGGVDSATGLYGFRLREDADIRSASDLNNPDNYRVYLGTTIAPYNGGLNLSVEWRGLRLSISGVYSFGAKCYDKIVSPASYLNARHSGVLTEEVQSQYSDLYANHLNVGRDRTDRWTASSPTGVTYPRIYDRFDARYSFAALNPMDYNIIDAIYLKDVSYLRIKSIILSYSFPKVTINLTLGNMLTLTRYDGMDPEVPGATYPTTRSVSLGVNVNL